MKITEIIERRYRPEGKKYYLSAVSMEKGYDGKWGNCLYIHFAKEDFPNLNYPTLKEVKWGDLPLKVFNYFECDVADHIDWHKGITFYEEVISIETGRTIVKAGCDFNHYQDYVWEYADNGKQILESEGPGIIEDFEKLIALRTNKGITT